MVEKRRLKVWNRRSVSWLFLVGILCASAYCLWPSYHDSFVSDDFKHLEFIADFTTSPLKAIEALNPYWIGWYYRPVQHWLMVFGYVLFGLNASGYYAINLGIHLLSTLFLYLLARKLNVSPYGALLAAGLFALSAQSSEPVGWISCYSVTAAALFSILSLYLYLVYLESRRIFPILWGVLFFLLALLSRQESIILPFLWLLTRVIEPKRGRVARVEVISACFMGLSTILYIVIQSIRPSWIPRTSLMALPSVWLRDLLNHGLSKFVVAAISSYTLLDTSIFPSLGILATLFTLLVMLALCLWFWKSGFATRIGLMWCVSFLLFLYLIVWATGDSGLTGRYLYLPYVGLALASGDTLGRISSISGRLGIVCALCAVQVVQVSHIKEYQSVIFQETRTLQDVERQLKVVLPEPTGDEHLFLYQYEPRPGITDYFQAMAAVWYGQRFHNPGGHWSRLRKLEWLDVDDYLFDYRDGVFYDLLPELQEFPESKLLWPEEGTLKIRDEAGASESLSLDEVVSIEVAGPLNHKRLSVCMRPPLQRNGSAVITYRLAVPDESDLRFSILREISELPEADSVSLRVSIRDGGAPALVVVEEQISPVSSSNRAWGDIVIPLGEYRGQTVDLQFEVIADRASVQDSACWSIPRLVRGDTVD